MKGLTKPYLFAIMAGVTDNNIVENQVVTSERNWFTKPNTYGNYPLPDMSNVKKFKSNKPIIDAEVE